MSDPGDLAAFLANRYDEAEALATAASHGTQGKWGPRLDDALGGHLLDDAGEVVVYDESAPSGYQFDHIAANDPAHRLADIKLKRAILALHAVDTRREQRHALPGDIADGKPLWWYEDEYDCAVCGWFATKHGGCETVRQLGTEFAEHAAYRSEWAP